MTTTFRVVNDLIHTGIQIRRGNSIQTVCSPHDKVDFGGFNFWGLFPTRLNADGDFNRRRTPLDYPAPELWKNSLIVGIGGRWYQGGVNQTFTAETEGELILNINDNTPQDNTGGWYVTVEHTPISIELQDIESALTGDLVTFIPIQSLHDTEKSAFFLVDKYKYINLYVSYHNASSITPPEISVIFSLGTQLDSVQARLVLLPNSQLPNCIQISDISNLDGNSTFLARFPVMGPFLEFTATARAGESISNFQLRGYLCK